MHYNYKHVNNAHSIECYLPYFNFSYCEIDRFVVVAILTLFSRKGYKCVHSIHHCVLVILFLIQVFPIICMTCIFLVKRLVVYSHYAIKPWPLVLIAVDSLIWLFDLKCSCLSKVEHNRRCIIDTDV
jgi:hypothetical protein